MRILSVCAIVAADLAVFVLLGLLLMGYDDNYDSAKGAYWSLSSMNATEQMVYLAYNAWLLIHAIAIPYIGYRVYRRIRPSDAAT